MEDQQQAPPVASQQPPSQQPSFLRIVITSLPLVDQVASLIR